MYMNTLELLSSLWLTNSVKGVRVNSPKPEGLSEYCVHTKLQRVWIYSGLL